MTYSITQPFLNRISLLLVMMTLPLTLLLAGSPTGLDSKTNPQVTAGKGTVLIPGLSDDTQSFRAEVLTSMTEEMVEPPCTSQMSWVYLPPGFMANGCTSNTNCCTNTICYGLQYIPANTGILQDYTTGFFVPCLGGLTPITYNLSCAADDNSEEIDGCAEENKVLFNSSGNGGAIPVTACVPVIIHQVCFQVPIGTSFNIVEDGITDLSTTIEISPTNAVFEYPLYTTSSVSRTAPVEPTDNGSTVACPALAVAPGYPQVLDQCGSVIPAVLSNTVDNPDPVTCNGTRVFTYIYTDCSGFMFDYKYTYTIIRNDFSVPADGSGTVSCPAQAEAADVPLPVVTSNCMEVLTPTGPEIDPNDTDTFNGCEGTITYRYTYTDCALHSHQWTYVFTVDYSGGLTPPTNGTSTVSCPAAAVDPGPPANITDGCGRSVSPVLVGQDAPTPTCEGTVVWRYRYTACDMTTTTDWTYTYTIDYSGGLTAPTSTLATVSCPAQATDPGAPPAIMDACGRTVNALFVAEEQTPAPVNCNGTIVWRYRYTACDGTTTADWTKTYTVIYSGGLLPPPNSTATVSCPAQATDPGAPPAITDACGRMVTALFVALEQTPAPVSCNGTITWRYRYTACDGTTTADWTKTYTVIYSGGLMPPPNSTATVSCPAQATDPGAPPAITDACGRMVTALFVALEQTPAPVSCNGTITWRYRYTACDGTTTADWTKTYTVTYTGGLLPPPNATATVSCPAQATDPGTPPAIMDQCGRMVTALFVDQEQTPAPVSCNGTIVWRYRYTACDGTTTADWTKTYTVTYTGGLLPPPNATATVSCPAQATDPGAPPAIMDQCGRTVNAVFVAEEQTPNPVTCNGTIIWRYRYTACDGTTTADWTKTYTVIYSGGLMPPPNSTATVSCPAQATDPGTPPAIMDLCGRMVTAFFVAEEQNPATVSCNGTITWRYRYTACDGTTTADWTKTYTVIYSGGLMPPPNGSSTVSCPAQATNPGDPTSIVDACGRIVSPVLIGQDAPTPECEGTVVWRYRYTACDMTTTADWIYTYTIDYTGGLTPPSNGSLTVSCPSAATDPGNPGPIADACGRTVPAVLIGQDAPTPECEGVVVWRYRYTACDLTTADWTYTYTIDYSGGLTPPADGGTTVSCPQQTTNVPAPPPPIQDACGRFVFATLVGADSPPPACEGTRAWRYRYTACDATTTADWLFIYTVDYTGGLLPPANGSSTVSCPQQATIQPPPPPPILDGCGRTVVPQLIGMDGPPPVCEGTVVWRYRYTACDMTTTADWLFTYTVDYSGGLLLPANGSQTVSCPQFAVDPGPPPTIGDACGRSVVPQLIGQDAPTPACEGQVVWRYRYTACDMTTTADWTYTYTIDYSGGLMTPPNGSSTVSCPAQAVDPGIPPSTFDACNRVVTPVLIGQDAPTPGCEGTVVWRYRYTACDLTTSADWTYTYTIDYSGGLTLPPNGSSTVSCPAQAVDPGAPNNIVDGCGRTVSAVLVGQDAATPACEGTVVWRYRYTACDLTTTADWLYTYTIDYSGGLTAPANGSSTVSCPAAAVNPTPPADIMDACGRTVSAVLVGQDAATPACEGTVVWRYRYTACDLTTTADWLYTYTIDYSGGLTPPTNQTATVACATLATDPGAPANILDACGRSVAAALVGSEQTPNPVTCNGTIVWRYRYTACDGTTTADWTKTYTVQHTTPVEFDGPVSTSTNIACYLEAAPPEELPIIHDACGNTLTPTGPVVGGTNTGNCGGTITYTYTYTDCAGLTYPWTYTNNVICDPVLLHVWLEGPYDPMTDMMKTSMNDLHTLPGQNAPPFYIDYPAGQPYTGAPWNYNGNPGTQWGDFGMQTPYPADVVDWVLVTIRKNGILPANNIWTCAGWVHADGSVTFPENCPVPAFTIVDNYFYMVQHRNHLGILSPVETDMPCGTAQLDWDFRASNSYQPIFRFGQKQVEPGVWAMFDANGEQINSISAINSADRTLWRNLQSTLGYSLGDFDLDTDTDSADENVWKNNQNRTSGVVFY